MKIYSLIILFLLSVYACKNLNSDPNVTAKKSLLTCPENQKNSSQIGQPHSLFSEYILVCHDEFNDKSLDPNLWIFDVEGNNAGWGNNEKQHYTLPGSRNAYLATHQGNGVLVIEARPEKIGHKNYTSARLHTHSTLELRYGLIEVRLRQPTDKTGKPDFGTWPAVWLLGANFNGWGHDLYGGDTPWPDCGEIDIIESNARGYGYSRTLGTLHWQGSNGYTHLGGYADLDKANSEYHTYSVKWDYDKIDFYLDNQQFFQHSFNDKAEIFRKKFFILLNLAVGGRFVGTPNVANYPQKMYIDYLRIYQTKTN